MRLWLDSRNLNLPTPYCMKPVSFSTDRRRFIRTAVGASIAPFILPSGLRAQTSANGKLTIGLIGNGKQGNILLKRFLGREDVVVIAVCDVDTNRREATKKVVEDYYGKNQNTAWKGCTAHNDFREVLDRKDIDAVVIATPDHWHAIIVVAAAQAGKDILCEKPLTQTVREAVAVVKAVRDNKRVFQTGSMQRSMREFRVAAEIVRNGGIGKISRVETLFGVPGVPCDLPEEAAEPGLDWDLWLGPAQKRPYNTVLAPRGVHSHYPMWRLYREFGGGFVTDWGAHHVDIAQWALGEAVSGPVEVIAPANYSTAKAGAKLRYAAGYELVHLEAADGRGASFFGSDGEVHVSRGKIRVIKDGKVVAKFWDKTDTPGLPAVLDLLEAEFLKDSKTKLVVSLDHYGNFTEAIRNRSQPITHEGIGASSVIACHLLNFAYYHGKNFKWDPKANNFADGTGDASWLHTPYRGDWKI
jgi:predicted dehydrogenase